jgi:hypothetical protein
VLLISTQNPEHFLCLPLLLQAAAEQSEVQALREQVAELEAALAREREKTQVNKLACTNTLE